MWICYKFLKSLTPTPLLFQHATAPKTVPAVVWNCFNYHPNPTPLSPKTAQHCAQTTPTLKRTLHPIKTLGSYNFCICKSWILHPLPSVKTNSLSCYQIVMLICKYQIYMLRKQAFTRVYECRVKKLLNIHLDSKNVKFNTHIPDMVVPTIEY